MLQSQESPNLSSILFYMESPNFPRTLASLESGKSSVVMVLVSKQNCGKIEYRNAQKVL